MPHRGRWWEIVEKYGVTVLYCAPTSIRTFMRWGRDIPAKYDLSSLRLLGSVGEPINPEAWMWYREQLGSNTCPIVDTWWQTENGHILISPLPGVTPTKPGAAMRALPGIVADIYDQQGNSVQHGGAGDREDVLQQLREHVRAEIGPIATPRAIMIIPDLPKTRSGKIMRRLLKDIAENREIGDVTTLADASVMDAIQEEMQARKAD